MVRINGTDKRCYGKRAEKKRQGRPEKREKGFCQFFQFGKDTAQKIAGFLLRHGNISFFTGTGIGLFVLA